MNYYLLSVNLIAQREALEVANISQGISIELMLVWKILIILNEKLRLKERKGKIEEKKVERKCERSRWRETGKDEREEEGRE